MLIFFGSVDEQQQHPHSERNTRPASQQHGSPQLIPSATSSAGPLLRSIGDDPQPACSSLASQVSQRIGSLSSGPADAPNPTRDGRCLACALATTAGPCSAVSAQADSISSSGNLRACSLPDKWIALLERGLHACARGRPGTAC